MDAINRQQAKRGAQRVEADREELVELKLYAVDDCRSDEVRGVTQITFEFHDDLMREIGPYQGRIQQLVLLGPAKVK